MVEKALGTTAVVYAGHLKSAAGSCRVAFPQLVKAEKSGNDCSQELPRFNRKRLKKFSIGKHQPLQRVWGNDLLSERTKMCVYQACVLSTLLYGSESWTTYARQERQLNGFHLRYKCIPGSLLDNSVKITLLRVNLQHERTNVNLSVSI